MARPAAEVDSTPRRRRRRRRSNGGGRRGDRGRILRGKRGEKGSGISPSNDGQMASCGPLPEGRPLFLAVYAAVVAGILFSGLVILSAVYSSPAAEKTPFYSRSSSMEKANSSSETIWSVEKNISHGKTKLKSEHMYSRAIWDPPVRKRMPDLKSFRLTKEMVEQRAENNIIIVTFGNYAFMDFILNWVRHLTDINVFNLLVGAMDTKLLEALYWKGIPVFDMGSHMATIDVGWGTPTFHKMGREKVLLINALLPFGVELLMCDTDMVWLKNPLPYIARFPEADILTSSDQTIPTVTDDSLEVWQQVTGAYNIGIFHWRPTEPAKKLAKEWKDMLLADDKIWDQTGFNDLVHKVLGRSVEGKNGLAYVYDGTLKLGVLPASIFCSGHTYFVQAMYWQLGLEPYAVHTTFQYAGTDGKRHRLREAMLFHDPPEYYDSSGGFLSFRPSIPKSLLLDGPHTVQSHFSLVNYQLKQIRTALAIASLLDRTLVMPPLWCRLDRLWYGHPGILEGTMTRQPFLCPMDHIFEVHLMLSSFPEAEFGPQIDFREYSFLQNPSIPSSVRKSVLDVEICDEHSGECNPAKQAVRHGVIQFPKNSTEQKYVQVFSQYKDFKVIHFSSMEDVFQGFADVAKEAKFRNRVKRYVGLWCCVENHEPGHIYYDMYWDEKPGWKPEPPINRSEDRPPW